MVTLLRELAFGKETNGITKDALDDVILTDTIKNPDTN